MHVLITSAENDTDVTKLVPMLAHRLLNIDERNYHDPKICNLVN